MKTQPFLSATLEEDVTPPLQALGLIRYENIPFVRCWCTLSLSVVYATIPTYPRDTLFVDGRKSKPRHVRPCFEGA